MAAKKKNVLLIVADQWRGDTLGTLKHPCIETPTLDRLAARGVVFSRHYSGSCPCAPGRASLLTGMHQMNHRVVRNGTPLNSRFDTMPRLARRLGYDPAIIGYTTTAPDPRDVHPNDPRFQVPGHIMDEWTHLTVMAPEKRPYYAYLHSLGYAVPDDKPIKIFLPTDVALDPAKGITQAPSRIAKEHSDTAWFTDAAVRYLASQGKDSWFLHLGYWKPHPPFVAPAPYHAHYDPADVPPPVRGFSAADEAAQHPLLDYILRTKQQDSFFEHGIGLVADLSERDIRQIRATYYGLMKELDDQLARVLDTLEKTGAIDDTLILFTSDHGEQLGNHYMLGKQGYFDDSYHIPMIVVDPSPEADATRGTVVSRYTEAVDVLPTILDWLGEATPRQCDGRSLLGFAQGNAPTDWRNEVHYEYDFREVRTGAAQRMLGLDLDQCSLSVIQDDHYKYVHFAALPPLLFDLQEDPHQFRNLAADPAHAKTVLDYAQRMLSWRLVNADKTLTGYEAGPGGLVDAFAPVLGTQSRLAAE